LGLKETFILPLARRWIAGTDLEAAIRDAKAANAKGMGAVMNFLGEDIADSAGADAALDEYTRLQASIAEEGLKGFASVKLTQLGLVFDAPGATRRLEQVAAQAERHGQLLWVDMEASKFTGETLAIYEDVLGRHKNVGVALQSYLRRSEADLSALLDKGGKVRLVKGAYREQRGATLPTKAEVSRNFEKLMGVLFERGDGFAIATHDGALVEKAKKLAESKHVDFRFEMLKGIRNDLKAQLVSSGYKVSEYLPYGDQWLAYSKRRITEHPSNMWLLIRSLV
jgi:proline dehydrogenase